MAYGSLVETIDQLRAEIDSLSKTLQAGGASEASSLSLEGTNAEWFLLGQARDKLPGLVAMLQVVVEHLDLLKASAERNRALAHEHMRNGDTRMSQRAKTIAQLEDRMRNLLLTQLTNAWNDKTLQEESV